VGLGNVSNLAPADLPVSTATQAALDLTADTTALALKANLASPTLTGTPLAPTAAAATNTTQIATTAFVQQEIAAKAPLASPALTGNPTAPTQTSTDSSTKLATTAFVQGLLANSGRMLAGSGVPSNAIGIDGDTYVRNDTPFVGVVYKKASGAWALAQGPYTLTTLPTASLARLGSIERVVDTTYAPSGIDLECVSYDGSTYWWATASRSPWILHNDQTASTTNAGTGSAQTVSTFTLPNRDDIFIPNQVSIEIRTLLGATGANGSKNVKLENLTAGGNPLVDGTTTSNAHLSLSARNTIHVRGASSGVSMAYSSNDTGSAGVAPSTYAFAWKNATLTWRKTLSSGSDTSQFELRRISLVYGA
jgi:hypothetical protein